MASLERFAFTSPQGFALPLSPITLGLASEKTELQPLGATHTGSDPSRGIDPIYEKNVLMSWEHA